VRTTLVRVHDYGGTGKGERTHVGTDRFDSAGATPFPAAGSLRAAGDHLGNGAVRGAVRRSSARPRRLLGAAGPRAPALAGAVHAGPRRIEGAVLPLVRRRQADRFVQLPRSAPRHAG